MIKGLVIIPARSGSKGIPNKNIKILNGKPLIHYTVEAAREVFDDESIIVSTDSERIKKVTEATGLQIPFLRPEFLATDEAKTEDVLIHSINYFFDKNNYHPDYIVLLQPTSPFRNGTHIREAISLFDKNCDMIVSVKETKSNPYYILFEEDEDGFIKKSKKGTFTRRQDCPKVWELNGAIYVINCESLISKGMKNFNKILKYEMEEVFSLDIDNNMDWKVAEIISKDL